MSESNTGTIDRLLDAQTRLARARKYAANKQDGTAAFERMLRTSRGDSLPVSTSPVDAGTLDYTSN